MLRGVGSMTPRLFVWWINVPVIFIPFSIFFICCASQFYFIRRVRQMLVERHPEIWAGISKRAWFVDNAVAKFIWWRKDKRLNDPELTRVVKQGAFLYYLALFVWVIYAGLLVTGLGFAQISFDQMPAWIESLKSIFH